jgi:uncharacterized protein
MSAADFLFTPSIQRVLAATLAQPNRSFTLQELLRLAASGRGSTQKQIERLIEAGVLIEETRRGRQRSIRANQSFFLFPELSSIARKSFGLAEPLRIALAPYADRIDQAFLFGSVAKGTDTQRSDIDLVVVGTAPLLDLNEAMHGAEQDLARPIHVSLYDPAEWLHLVQTDPVLAQIASGPKLMLLPHDPSP